MIKTILFAICFFVPFCIGFLIKDLNTDNELVYITDTGYINKKILDIIHNKNTYIIESNHDTELLRKGPYPFYLKQRILSDTGHLSNKDCCKYLKDLVGKDTKNIVLAHISENNNTKEIVLDEINNMVNDNGFNYVNIYVAEQKHNLDLTSRAETFDLEVFVDLVNTLYEES